MVQVFNEMVAVPLDDNQDVGHLDDVVDDDDDRGVVFDDDDGVVVLLVFQIRKETNEQKVSQFTPKMNSLCPICQEVAAVIPRYVHDYRPQWKNTSKYYWLEQWLNGLRKAYR